MTEQALHYSILSRPCSDPSFLSLLPSINGSINLAIVVPPKLATSTVRITAMTITDNSPHGIETDIPIKLKTWIDLNIPEHRIRRTLCRSEGYIIVGVVIEPII